MGLSEELESEVFFKKNIDLPPRLATASGFHLKKVKDIEKIVLDAFGVYVIFDELLALML